MRLKYSTIILLLSVLGLSSFQAQAAEKAFKITNPNQGHQIFTDALNNKDVNKLVALYAKDAVMIAPGNKIITGTKDIRAFFEEAVKGIEKIKLSTVFRVNYKDTVVFRSKYILTIKQPDGKLITQSASGIEVEQKQKDGSWLFIIDHHYGGTDLTDFKKMNTPS